ncbi:hypothetical protein, partial [Neisseria meningitidis]|uniref:hypothetical protein n=1 Tax=Neisseria meningitidis TaxID=487 RepID=UPI001C8F7B1C
NHSANPRQKPKPPNPDGLPKTLDAVELAGLDELVWQNWWAEAHPTTRPKSHLRSIRRIRPTVPDSPANRPAHENCFTRRFSRFAVLL